MNRRRLQLVSRRKSRGFTLLEAIVAMVIFSLGAFALYGWLSTNVITLNRIRELQKVEAQTHSALDLMRRTNPMEAPQGQRRMGDFTVTWTSKLVEPVRAGSSQAGSPTLFVVGLYDLEVRLQRAGQQPHSFHVRQVGWKQIHAIE
ncbi:MAG: type II secretion system protein [Thermomonas sp.]